MHIARGWVGVNTLITPRLFFSVLVTTPSVRSCLENLKIWLPINFRIALGPNHSRSCLEGLKIRLPMYVSIA